jgi:hypothetical protein
VVSRQMEAKLDQMDSQVSHVIGERHACQVTTNMTSASSNTRCWNYRCTWTFYRSIL